MAKIYFHVVIVPLCLRCGRKNDSAINGVQYLMCWDCLAHLYVDHHKKALMSAGLSVYPDDWA